MTSVPTLFHASQRAAIEYLIQNEKNLPFPVGEIRMWEPTTFPIDANRNECVGHILNNDIDMSVWIDGDETLKQDTIFQLFAKGFGRPIYAGVYYLKKEPYYPIVFKANAVFTEFQPIFKYPDEPFYADMIGMGCVKIDTEVFKKLDKPYFKYQEIPESLSRLGEYVQFKIKNGVGDVSEDVWFWKQIRQKTDYRVVVDPNIDVGHITQIPITKSIAESAWEAYRQYSKAAADAWETLPEGEPVGS